MSDQRLERSHFARRDLDWLPRSLRSLRWGVTAILFAAPAMALGALASMMHRIPVLLGLLFIGFAAVATMLGEWYARKAMRARLRKIAHGGFTPGRLAGGSDGELVGVRGRVVARESIHSLLGEGHGVYRRLFVDLDGLRLVHETARDFLVVDSAGASVFVQVAGARLLDPDDRTELIPGAGEPADRILGLPWPDGLDDAFRRRGKVREEDGSLRHLPAVLEGHPPEPIRAAETLIADGAEVEVLGIKSSAVDPGSIDQGLRETPFRTALSRGTKLPLLISRLS